MPDDRPPRWGVATTPDQLGDVIAALRAYDGLTQAELAERAGVTRRYVNEVEGGHATIALTRFFDVVRALGCRVRIEEAPQPAPQPGIEDLGW